MSSTLTALYLRLTGLVERTKRWHWLWPPIGFAAGICSFFLVNRQQWLGGMLALGMMLAWLILIAEGLWSRLRRHRGQNALPRKLATFVAQLIQQETLCFTLPFFLATTDWASGQAGFTLLLCGATLLSILDPFYYRLAERHRWLYFGFHALCVFVVVLVTLPLLLELTTGESLLAACAAMSLFALPSVANLRIARGVVGGLAMIGISVMLGVGAWGARAWIPPATLWINASSLSPDFDTAARAPRGEMQLTPAQLSARGLYAFTAIRAPRGLSEKVYHVWRHDGKVVDRIALNINGGRSEGYRAWTHKTAFPQGSEGEWRIDVETMNGQRIGSLRFVVSDDPQQATLADSTISQPPGIPGWRITNLIPGL